MVRLLPLRLAGDFHLRALLLRGERHTGYIFATPGGPVFYIVDATWDVEVMWAGKSLPWISRRFQTSYAEYVQTQEKLRRLKDVPLVACHCPRTQELQRGQR